MTTTMTNSPSPGDIPPPPSDLAVPAGCAYARMAIGLLQGLLLYALYYRASAAQWSAPDPVLLRPAVLAALFVPLAAISAWSQMQPRKLLLWCLALTLAVMALGAYDAWRADLGSLLPQFPWGSPYKGYDALWQASGRLAWYLIGGLFVAQALVLAGNAEGRWIARYAGYYEIAWKLGLQLALATLFTLLLWLVLVVGSLLFAQIKLAFMGELLQRPWFAMPVSTLAFACALHLADVRPALVVGAHRLLLAVLSWLLPVSAILVALFLLSMLGTGLQPLWETGHATAALLGATLLLVVQINVVYQDGAPLAPRAGRFMRACLGLACLLPLPLVVLAVVSLRLRVLQYGWTVDRVTAAVLAMLAACYAVGYAAAVLRRRSWPGLVAPTNVAASFVLLALLAVFLSPLADPARIAVNDQVRRYQAGLFQDDKDGARFLGFLRFDGARFGVQQLLAVRDGRIRGSDAMRAKADEALYTQEPWNMIMLHAEKPALARVVRVHPDGRQLPAGFAGVQWNQAPDNVYLPQCLKGGGNACDAYYVRPDPQGEEMLLVLAEDDSATLFGRSEHAPDKGDAAPWAMVGRLFINEQCTALLRRDAERGRLDWRQPRQRDLVVNGTRLTLTVPEQYHNDCRH